MRARCKKAIITATFILSEFFGLTLSVNALTNPITSVSFSMLIEKIAEIVTAIGIPLAVVAIIWSGFLFATARGDEQQVAKAKKTFFWAAIGTMLILGARIFATALRNVVEGL